MEDNLKKNNLKKMEDDLKKKEIGRQPQLIIFYSNDNLKKNGRQPQKKMEDEPINQN